MRLARRVVRILAHDNYTHLLGGEKRVQAKMSSFGGKTSSLAHRSLYSLRRSLTYGCCISLSRMGRHEGAILNSRSTSSHELWQLVVKSGCVDTLVLMRATPCGSPQGLLRFGGGAPVSPGAGETTHAGPISLVGVELFDPFSSGVVSGMFT